ncbi:Serotransferrin-1 [Labeo rohita]|uniref:Serotransferrin n=1 Tax=Labeo rohita TaxID=84645 RepID=A0ABQ8MX81_LABRO|nr:Serotransferrin-1 [Labeo rohita]
MNILLISLLGCLVVALPSASAQKVRWCVKSQNEMNKCQHLSSIAPDLECHLKTTVTECMTSIKDGDTDAITVDGQHIYLAGLLPYDLRPIIQEKSKKPVSRFFSSGCAPGISKAQYPNLCQACQGDCSCSQNEKHSGDEGALQCLKGGHGQVAFVCQDSIPLIDSQTYHLMCMDGSRKSIEDYKNCHFAKEPFRAVISRRDADSQHIYKVLKQIPDLDLFSSAAFGGKDLIFSDSTSELVELAKSMDSFIYLGQNYYKAMRALKDRSIEWCTISHAEQQKCDKLNSKIPRIACKRESSVEECFKKIMRREADAIAVDGGQGSGVTWNNLKGRKSCHTGLNRNAGWKVPDSAICGKTPDCTLYKFFSKGCAPGADPQSNMCELCKGSGKAVGDENKCKASSGEIYYGYDGAFRCLAEKTGEVAFIKHTIVGDYTDGKGPEWAKDLKSDEFELICPETPGQTVEHTAFAKCNLARVPAHAVITFEDARTDVVNVLKQAQANSEVQLFKSEGERNLLFTDSTKCLQENTKSLVDFMTQKYIDMIERTYETGQSKPVVALPSASAQKVRWCVKSQTELIKCQHLATKPPDLECHLKTFVTEVVQNKILWDGPDDMPLEKG